MIVEYNLVGDDWFTEMYNIRESWIPAFFKETPMSALMKTTSRSESANAFFNIYVKYSYDLVRFHKSYDHALETQHDQHSHNENVTRTTYPHIATPYKIEEHASNIYTRTIFNEFQKEIIKALYFCFVDDVKNIADTKIYTIVHNNRFNEPKVNYKVVYKHDDGSAECECNFFIRNGYLCRHALRVLINLRVDRIPDRYIARRWTRDLVPVQIQSAKVRYDEVDTNKEGIIKRIYSGVDEVVSLARNHNEHLGRFAEIIEDYAVVLKGLLPQEDPSKQKEDAMKEYFGVPVPDNVEILPPTGIRNKGSGTGKRLVSVSEKIQSASKKPKRKCKKCGKADGHDSRNCDKIRRQV